MATMQRREFLQRSALGLLGASSWMATGCGDSPTIRPNVLVVISDDQSFAHTSVMGSKMVQTPAFDRIANEGVLFTNAFVSAPSCGPARASLLTGQEFYRLREASMNHTIWPDRALSVYTDELAKDGYHVGFTGKGWGPGNWQVSRRPEPPTGKAYNERKLQAPGTEISDIDYAANFEAFLQNNPESRPFCFWAGVIEPHRPFNPGIGVKNGKRLEDMEVPAFLPDTPEVRGDLADYAYEIEWYDAQLARMLQVLENSGQLANTLIIVTSDNGMPFPRAKGNLYDYGARVPLAIRWGNRANAGRRVDDFVSHCDIAPTILEAASQRVPGEITGRSLMYHLESRDAGMLESSRDAVFYGIERHLPGSRPEGAGYPARAVRDKDYLYIHNYTPDRNPVGDRPGIVWPEDDPVGGFGDTDGGRSKTAIAQREKEDPVRYKLAFGPRPVEELYRISDDPFQMKNLAAEPSMAVVKQALAQRLLAHLRDTNDPRELSNWDSFDAIMKRFPTLGSNETSGKG